MAKLIENTAILIGGSILILSGLVAAGILFLAVAIIVVGRRLKSGLTMLATGTGSDA